MKKLLLNLLTLAIILAAALPALALGPLDIEAELPIISQYVWRGMVLTPEPVLQPSLSASILGFGFGFWGNMDLTDVNGYDAKFNEINWVASYGFSFPLVSLGAGLIYYDYPNTDINATAEVYFTGSVSVLLSPTLEYYYDFKEVDGGYVNLGISHPVELSESLDLELGASLGYGSNGYNKHYFILDTATATDFLLTAGVPIKPIPFFTLTPSVSYSTLLGDPKTNMGDFGGDTDAFFYGFSALFSF